MSVRGRKVRCIDGKTYTYDTDSIIGFCNNALHIGYITAEQFAEHQCEARYCPCFRKNFSSIMWKKKAKEEYRRFDWKTLRKYEREKEKIEQDIIRYQTNEIWDYANLCIEKKKYKLLITNVRKLAEGYFLINYVSNNKYADWNLYSELISLIQIQFGIGVKMKHVRAFTDRHFLTIKEYEQGYY